MYTIYQKCEKSSNNPYGILKIEEPGEINKPFLLCLTSQDQIPKSVFGLIKEGARAARVRTTDELAGGYKIEEMPVAFLGLLTEKEGTHNSLCNDFIYPYLKQGKDIPEMIKRARMMNFFLYCDATNMYVNLEKQLMERLKEDGYSEDDILNIVSQIGVISIASQIDVSKLQANIVLFKDANDRDVYDYVSKVGHKKMENMARESIVGSINSNGNVITYVYNGSGNHDLKEYFKDACIVKSSLCAAVSKLLENSIENYHSDHLIPLSHKDLLRQVIRYNGEFQGVDFNLDKLDSEIQYGEVSQYTHAEHLLLCEEEENYKKMVSSEYQKS